MNDEELKNMDIQQKEIKSGSNTLVLIAILIFLIIVIVTGAIIRTGTFY
jgi:hypothetical protein